MSALPAEPPDPCHPAVILSQLVDEDERASFRRQYQEALREAEDPENWGRLQKLLRLWHGHVLMMQQPGYHEAWEQARQPGGSPGGIMLEDYIRQRRTA